MAQWIRTNLGNQVLLSPTLVRNFGTIMSRYINRIKPNVAKNTVETPPPNNVENLQTNSSTQEIKDPKNQVKTPKDPFNAFQKNIGVVSNNDDVKAVTPKDSRLLNIALVGTPNAGKSTLVNNIVGSKVAIVSPRPQTTRDETIGVCTKGNTQLVFYDTPGIVPQNNIKTIQHDIINAAWKTVFGADMTLLIVDLSKRRVIDEDIEFILKRMDSAIKERKSNTDTSNSVLVLNKIDLVDKRKANYIRNRFMDTKLFIENFQISALHGNGIQDLRDFLMIKAKPKEWDYSPDTTTDMSSVEIVTEIIREKLYNKLYYELPYVVEQENLTFGELPDGTVRIDQVLLVPKEGQKVIILGSRGSLLKSIKEEAQSEISKYLNKKVQLFLYVKTNPHMRENK